MRCWGLLAAPALLLVLPAWPEGTPSAAIPATGRLNDSQAEALARQAIASTNVEFQKKALARLQTHRYKSTKAKEREYVLFVQGILEDRLESTEKASQTLKKLERTWPKSPFVGEANVILGAAAVESRHFKDGEERLRKALTADIPVEGKRRAQELILWSMAEQGRAAEGADIIRSLFPLGQAQPSEKGLVGIMEALCVMQDKEGADGTRRSYMNFHPKGAFVPRMDLNWALLMGKLAQVQGSDAKASAELIRASAEGFRKLIMDFPSAPESDEARLALATILAEGKLPKQELSVFGDPARLLADRKKSTKDDPATRRALMTELRVHVNNGRWKQALDVARTLKGMRIDDTDVMALTQLRADAFRAYAGDLLPKGQPGPLLDYLDAEAIQTLPAEQRKLLMKLLAEKGLPSAARTVLDLSPRGEQAELRRIALASASPDGDSAGLLSLLPPKGEGPAEALKRAQAEISLDDWPKARTALLRAKPGPERIAGILALLRRPADKDEAPTARLQEAEGWLSRCTEKSADKEGLAVLVADLRAKAGRWREALALYPAKAQPEYRGWVALMRATCQIRLGQKEAAKATLQASLDEAAFRMERRTLGKQLGMN